MAFNDGFDLRQNSFVERPQRPAPAPAPAPTPNLPLEIQWLLQSIEDDLTMLEDMTDLPRRRDGLVRRASRTLAALAEITLGHELAAEDWRSVVSALRETAAGAMVHHRRDQDVASLLDLDLVAEHAERAANVARETLQEYFLLVCRPRCA